MIFVQMSNLAKAIIHKCLPKARYSSVFSLGFSFLSFFLFTSALITGCGSTKHIQTEIVRDIQKDTIYVSNIQYDSIYVLQNKYTDRSKDTLFIKETNVEYRYKLLRDTIYKTKIEHQRDFIPYEVRITESIKIPRKLTWYDHTTYVIF